MRHLLFAFGLALGVALATPALARAQEPDHIYAVTGIGTSHPFRPGSPSAALEVGLDARYRTWGLSFRAHEEGRDTLRGQGTASLGRLGVSWSPALEGARFVRTEAYAFLLIDLVPSLGGGLDVTYGWQNPWGTLGAFTDFHTPYYTLTADASWLHGLTLGVEGQATWRFLHARARVGTVGGTRPYAMLLVGVGYTWP